MHRFSWLIFIACLGSAYAQTSAVLPVPTAVVNYQPLPPLLSLERALIKQAPDLAPAVLRVALTAAEQASVQGIVNNRVLTVINYALPANRKRLWVFDLATSRLLFHTYVTHGLGSGTLYTHHFSNHRNSHASSYGVFNTERSYAGSHGIAVRLFGLDAGFNDHAAQRAIVIHGAWYVDEKFIQRYGRPGRSWGCPAVPEALIAPLVTTIRYGSLVVVYYPDKRWLMTSDYLPGLPAAKFLVPSKTAELASAPAESIVYLDTNQNGHYQEFKPVLAMSATRYQQFFKQAPPLTRMLRRRLQGAEYIALTPQELVQLGDGPQHTLTAKTIRAQLRLVTAEVYRDGAFFKTRLRSVSSQIPISLRWSQCRLQGKIGYAEFSKQRPMALVATPQFIRWIGL